MGLRIANNISAMTTHRWLGVSDKGLTKSLERLSSGYRINRAADDAAGLAISQSFRADIASFKVASRNTSEASALLQVAEGGMDQIGNMLIRLKELATQAASANAGSAERAKIAAESDALVDEIDRIANATKYGSKNVLDGTFGMQKTAATYSVADAGDTTDAKVYGAMTYTYSVTDGALTGAVDLDLTITGLSTMSAQTFTFSATTAGIVVGNGTTTDIATDIAAYYGTGLSGGGGTLTFANLGLTLTVDSPGGAESFSAIFCAMTMVVGDTGVTSLNTAGAVSGTYVFSTAAAGSLLLGNGSSTQTVSNITAGTASSVNFDLLGITFDLGTNYTDDDLEGIGFTISDTGTGSTFQIGAENATNNRISISIDGVDKTDLSITAIDLTTDTGAQAAITTIDTAISSLSSSRGEIGAYMNRLSYANANLAATIENVQAAESVIRDVDMALEMTQFTKNQILLQSGTAMLAQANAAPQQVLSLFG